jgi:glycosyltransferase involved in cell wall biosynthesis
LAPDYDHQSREQVGALGAEPIDHHLSRTGLNAIQDAWASYKLSRIIRELRPDVVLSYYIKPVIFGTFAASLARVPHRVAMIEGLGSVFTASDRTESMPSKLLRMGVTRLYKTALGYAHRVVFLNPDDRREFVDKGIVQSGKSSVLGGIGVDLSEWPFAESVVDPLTFVFVGRLLKSKGLLEFVEAARNVKTKSPAAQFVILGDADTKLDSLSRNDISQWVSEGAVSWPGHVDVRPWLARASVFVLPSYREGVPRSTQEAMAMGRPVITTDVPGCRETVEEGVNGFLVPVRNAQALAQAMLRFVNNPELVKTMGLASRRMAEEKFDVRKANAKLLAILGFSSY